MKKERYFILGGLVAALAVMFFSQSLFSVAQRDNGDKSTEAVRQTDGVETDETANEDAFTHFAYVTSDNTLWGQHRHIEYEMFDTVRMCSFKIAINKDHNILDAELQKEFFKYHVNAFPTRHSELRNLAYNGGTLDLSFRSMGQGEMMKIEFSNEELRDLFANGMTEYDAKDGMLKIYAQELTSLMHGLRDGHIRQYRASYDGNNLVVECSLDERYIDMDLMKRDRKSLQKEIESDIAHSGGDNGVIDKFVKDHGKGMVFRYRGNRTGKYVDARISNDLL